ncbi:MAG: AzlD domain-containing protein [Bacillota bacterium]|nr:AzlD domain-containing protein [Bacillota bacterium]
MSEKLLWGLILGLAAANYLLRLLPFALLAGREVPPTLRRWLEFIPVAVLAAVLAQSIFWQEGGLRLAGNRLLLPALLTLAFAVRVRSLTWTLLFGMAARAAAGRFGG